jgi:hypothetical protein
MISVLGSNFLRMIRCTDSTLKPALAPLAKRDPQEYLSHCWVTEGERERLVIGCVSGEILLVEHLDLKAVLHTDGGAAADCLVPWAKGFLVGQSNGALAVFERDERETYLRTKVLRFKEPHRPVALALGVNEAHLAVAVASGKLFMLAFGALEILKLDEDNFEPVAGADSTLQLF